MSAKPIITLFLLTCFFMACSDSNTAQNNGDEQTTENPAALLEAIDALEAELKSQNGQKMDKQKVSSLIDQNLHFAKVFPKEEKSPSLMFRAADVARGVGKYGQAIDIWKNLRSLYPDYERSPDALFLTGFTYENNLNEKTQAKELYNQFLEEYPDHALNTQVKQTLDVIDKSPEELIKEFQRKNKPKED